MSKKPARKAKAPSKAKGRKGKAAKVSFVRFVCKVCSASGKGGFFSAEKDSGTKCPYCKSASVKMLG